MLNLSSRFSFYHFNFVQISCAVLTITPCHEDRHLNEFPNSPGLNTRVGKELKTGRRKQSDCDGRDDAFSSDLTNIRAIMEGSISDCHIACVLRVQL